MQIKFHPKQMEAFTSKGTEILFGGAAGGGKLLKLNEHIPTPSGWTKMGDLKIGDKVFDKNGKICNVVHLSEINLTPELYEFTFDDGTTITSCIDHQWVTFSASELSALTKRNDIYREKRRENRPSRAIKNVSIRKSNHMISHNREIGIKMRQDAPEGTVRTTREIVDTLLLKSGRKNHAIKVQGFLDTPEANLELQPYVLGAWLGDGTSVSGGFTGIDKEIWERIESFGFKVTHAKNGKSHYINGLVGKLKEIGVLNKKHIPQKYLRASREQRLELLRGLMDTDGTVAKDSGCAEFCNTNKNIIDGVCELIASLGNKYFLREGKSKLNGRDCGPKWTIKWIPNDVVFNLQRKASIQKLATRRTSGFRYIVSAKKVKSEPGRCIMVDSPSHTYLAGKQMIPTHNSFFIRGLAMSMAYDCPGIQIYLFRRAFPDLEKNHVHGENGLLSMMSDWFKSGFVTYNASKHIFNFANGSTIFLCHLGSKRDLQNYQGAEIHILLMDEAGQFEEDEYRYLRARVRLGGWNPPERWEYKLPLILLSANPGGIGHMWLRDGFVTARPAMEIERMKPAEGGMLRQYIPARLSDNPTMDVDYADKLAGMGNPELVRAWLDGDWDVVAGTALELLKRKTHGVRRFPVPQHWTRIMGMDWGTAKPFAVLWCAVAEGGVVIKAKTEDQRDVFIPDGALVFYREYYGWNGKADTGCRLTSTEVAREILNIEDGETIDYRVGDSAMWAQTDGPSPQENMYKATNGKFILRAAQKDRAMNYVEIRNRLKGNEDGQPMLFVMEDLLHFWRTVPNLQLDEQQPEKGPDSQQEDHIYDALAYICRSRPYTTSIETRREREFKKFMSQAKKAGVRFRGL